MTAVAVPTHSTRSQSDRTVRTAASAARRRSSRRRSPGSIQDFGLFDASPIIINPADGGAGRDFANAVALVESALDPPEMLPRLKAIERAFGRRPGRRWGPRRSTSTSCCGAAASPIAGAHHPPSRARSAAASSSAAGRASRPAGVVEAAEGPSPRLPPRPLAAFGRSFARQPARRRPSGPNKGRSIRGESATASSLPKAEAASTG